MDPVSTAAPESARRRATRARLVQAAQQEFGKNGIDATSVEQLCEAAGFTRGAFYSNFATKDDLCVAIAEHFAEQTIRSCHEALASLPDRPTPVDIVAQILGAGSLTEDEHRTQLELQLRAWRDPELGARMAAVRADTLPLAAEVIARATAKAGVEMLVDVNDLIRIFEALFFAPTLAREGTSLRLIACVANRLIRDTHPQEQP